MEEEMVQALPPGAIPSDVADDVDIKASAGEYIIPAEVVRYLGMDKLEKMVNKAKEELAQLEAGGRIGGEQAPEPKAPPAPEGGPQGFQEGGMVVQGGGTTLPQDQGFAGVKKFKNQAGQEVFIPFVNGEPMFPVPQGYTEAPTDPAQAPQDRVEQVAQSAGVNTPQRSDARENDAFVAQHSRPDVSEWTPEDFVGYGERRGGVGDRAMQALTAAIPLGGLASQVARRITDRRVANYIDQMLETRTDLKGNPLSTEQMSALSETREGAKNVFSQETGLSFSPLDRLGDVIGKVMEFGRPKTAAQPQQREATSAPRSSVNEDAQRMMSASSQVGDVVSSRESRGSRSDYGMGSDLGRDPSRGPSMGSIASGGLYGKGGMVARRKRNK